MPAELHALGDPEVFRKPRELTRVVALAEQCAAYDHRPLVALRKGLREGLQEEVLTLPRREAAHDAKREWAPGCAIPNGNVAHDLGEHRVDDHGMGARRECLERRA